MKKGILMLLIVLLVSCQKEENEPTPTPTTNYLNPNLTYGSVTDVDGNEYATIQIGTQEWMAENLRTTAYANGDPIPNVSGNAQWPNLNTGAWVHYNDDNQFENPFGKLYNWYAVADPRNVCPTGWRVPTDSEWTALIDYLGDEAIAGGKLKTTGIQYWQSPNTDATNESGFSGLPGGGCNYARSFGAIGSWGGWWSSTEISQNHGAVLNVSHISPQAIRNYIDKRAGYSVRCLKD